MKVLAIYCNKFGYTPKIKNLESVPEISEGKSYTECLVAFIQVEESDEEKEVKSRAKKLVNHLKWVLRKNKCKSVILHSFAHLSESKASIPFAQELFDIAERKFNNVEIKTAQTPFGYFLDLDIQAPGFSLARVWTSL
ncbi:hypothetical protein EYV94_13855 [Puteibacter caeruleilacunae]|nr:hypothetical protein EYV94_13855 [Puteibacter caeruleilacunae]